MHSACSLPPCGGGLGRGVAARSEFATTPLPVPPPQGGRELWGEAVFIHGLSFSGSAIS
jgi:hypothetical protein